MENYLSQMGMAQKHLAERYTEYGPAHDQSLYYPYEPAPSSSGHVTPYKHHFGGGSHKNNAAMSALTLLAFLFFLHILQSCLKDHMNTISTPQVMIMTGGREGEENIAKHSRNKIDKTGEIEIGNRKSINQNDAVAATNDNDRYLTKITSSEYGKNIQNNKNIFRRNDNYPDSSEYVSVANF